MSKRGTAIENKLTTRGKFIVQETGKLNAGIISADQFGILHIRKKHFHEKLHKATLLDFGWKQHHISKKWWNVCPAHYNFFTAKLTPFSWKSVIYWLTHSGRVTHICVSELTIIGSDNGLSPGRRQAIIWTNDGILVIKPLGTNFSEILIGIQTFSLKKMHLKMSSAKWRPYCFGLNELISQIQWHKYSEINWDIIEWLVTSLVPSHY